ncbi:dihydrofolate reductase [Cobetia sp. 4B]|uniref:dihydrofolate reductase n=1 Tax=Cobetia TaxID=204286 RepID=UPI001C04AF7F|nr:dihydrofolate reductase [Cobetia sp. 4B]MBR9755351.1 dihydrofolate reductase [Gammaproteobacteria bacterium]QWN36274.1 dihydrofolate reductase [Cobetia sp. 4B]
MSDNEFSPLTAAADTVVPVAMIAAMSVNRVIGVDNQLPWYLPEDLKFFKHVTQGKPVIMGRKTFASIGRPLPNRLNIVVTRDSEFSHDGVRVCSDLAAALSMADHHAMIDGVDEIMVIGGGQIYAQALPVATRLYLTEVAVEIEGDAHFPALDASWQEAQRVPGESGEGLPAYDFVRFERRDV